LHVQFIRLKWAHSSDDRHTETDQQPSSIIEGRPSTRPTCCRLESAKTCLKRLDDWRRREHDPPSRPEAIRRLVGHGLKAKSKI
jgi:hypothetical protein